MEIQSKRDQYLQRAREACDIADLIDKENSDYRKKNNKELGRFFGQDGIKCKNIN